MKKLFLYISLLTCVIGFAQDSKPTKEETITFMSKTLKAGIGMGFEWDSTIQDVSFHGDKLVIEATETNRNLIRYNISDLPWEYLDKSNFESANMKCNFTIRFTKSYKNIITTGGEIVTEFPKKMNISIPEDKIESFKKACIRLCEIAKEENKDPFEKQ